MRSVEDRLIFSATDLSGFLACQHLTLLNRRAALGGPKPPMYPDPSLDLLRLRGAQHEQAFLARMKSDGARRVVELTDPEGLPYSEHWSCYAEATLAAMRSGADVIFQAGLFDGTWVGKADFLVRVEEPSDLGEWSYEVVDTKLAREAKGGALLQVLLYADLIATVQGRTPERVHIALGGPDARLESFRVADYAAYFRSIQRRFLEFMRAPPAVTIGPEPVEHCEVCAWSSTCSRERREVDHLSLVANISRTHRRALDERGITTVASLAALALPVQPRFDGVGDATLTRIREQARLQVEGRTTGRHMHELLRPVTAGQGLAALPEPSPGDLFFDLEGDPFALTHGIEYLFGFADRDGVYTGWWALDRESERSVFERFIDLVMRRLEDHPDLHIYHYAPYEPTALKRLMGRYATREDQVDRLLRGRVLVDLYRVVRQGLRASVESYSIKRLEPFYGYARAVELDAARSALAHFEAWLELGGDQQDELLRTVAGYNRDDCISTLCLHGWLEALRGDLSRMTGEPVPRPQPVSSEPGEAAQERDRIVDALVARLTSDVPADESLRSGEQQARWLMAQLLAFHRRESKSDWWEYYRCMELSEEEMTDDRATMGGLDYVGPVGTVKRSTLHQYRFPPQDHGIREGKAVIDPATDKSHGRVYDIDNAAGTVVLKRGTSSKVPHPRALVPHDIVGDTVQRDSLLRTGEVIAARGFSDPHPRRAVVDLLLRRPPRAGQQSGASLMHESETVLDAAVRLVERIEDTVLPIQGPPGAGKTFTAARMIVQAIQRGMRVGITATSHKVIGNLLEEVCRAARAAGAGVSGIQKADEEQKCSAGEIALTDTNEAVRDALGSGAVRLAAGTAWLWSREDMTDAVDILVVDEAGQFSLASAIAVAPAARSLVLVGDPQQLDQPIQGVHPPGVDVSALDHLLGGRQTVSPDGGLFLDRTWRLHPDICAFTSEIFYDGRLTSRAGLERQAVQGNDSLHGSGLRYIAVDHAGNTSESPEEVAVVRRLFDELLGGASWTDANGDMKPIRIDDILVVAPYNVQVAALAAALPAGARVGTVDRFQGQEAPIVIYSMATSSAEDAPRGMSFLYSPNRLNVATSRARCLAVVVSSPRLFTPDARTPDQMRLANAFCRLAELAR